MKKIISRILITALILTAAFIVITDSGNSAANNSGAGDIWWVDVPEIEESYQQTINRK